MTGADAHAPARKWLARVMAVQLLYACREEKDAQAIEAALEASALKEYRAMLEETCAKEMLKALPMKPEGSLLKKIVRGVFDAQEALDAKVQPFMDKGWSWERLPSLLQAIVRAGMWEMAQQKAPASVIISQYVEVASLFFDPPEQGFVHAVLDKVGKGE